MKITFERESVAADVVPVGTYTLVLTNDEVEHIMALSYQREGGDNFPLWVGGRLHKKLRTALKGAGVSVGPDEWLSGKTWRHPSRRGSV